MCSVPLLWKSSCFFRCATMSLLDFQLFSWLPIYSLLKLCLSSIRQYLNGLGYGEILGQYLLSPRFLWWTHISKIDGQRPRKQLLHKGQIQSHSQCRISKFINNISRYYSTLWSWLFFFLNNISRYYSTFWSWLCLILVFLWLYSLQLFHILSSAPFNYICHGKTQHII